MFVITRKTVQRACCLLPMPIRRFSSKRGKSLEKKIDGFMKRQRKWNKEQKNTRAKQEVAIQIANLEKSQKKEFDSFYAVNNERYNNLCMQIANLEKSQKVAFENFEKRQDERFGHFEKRQDERFGHFEKRQDERFEHFEKKQDERFGHFEKKQDERFSGFYALHSSQYDTLNRQIADLLKWKDKSKNMLYFGFAKTAATILGSMVFAYFGVTQMRYINAKIDIMNKEIGYLHGRISQPYPTTHIEPRAKPLESVEGLSK